MTMFDLVASSVVKSCREDIKQYLFHFKKNKLEAEEAITFMLCEIYQENIRDSKTLLALLIDNPDLMRRKPRKMPASEWKCSWFPYNFNSATCNEEPETVTVSEWYDRISAGIVSKDESLSQSIAQVIIAELLPKIARRLRDDKEFASLVAEKYL